VICNYKIIDTTAIGQMPFGQTTFDQNPYNDILVQQRFGRMIFWMNNVFVDQRFIEQCFGRTMFWSNNVLVKQHKN
jgi:hypothetical protein